MNAELKQRAREWLRLYGDGDWPVTIQLIRDIAAVEAHDCRDDARVRELVATWEAQCGDGYAKVVYRVIAWQPLPEPYRP